MDDHGGETTDTESMYGEIYDKIQQKKEVKKVVAFVLNSINNNHNHHNYRIIPN